MLLFILCKQSNPASETATQIQEAKDSIRNVEQKSTKEMLVAVPPTTYKDNSPTVHIKL